ncbi:MAG TPA: VWA domain-containing protein [Pyrinomonadaceae bacterium]|nr:VWA domain-containing protein [Pyrinomonadaceae bacterium]
MKIRTFLALLVMFCIFLPALAQTKPAPQPQKPADDKDDVVKITTNLVQVDAVVTKDGKLVKDLTADDFEIYEDGRKQAISSFAYISNVPGTNSLPVNTVRDKGGEVVPFAPVKVDVPRRTIALLVDDLGLSAESIGQVRRQLKKFIAEEIQPNDLVAIIRVSGEVGALQQFTNDRRVLNRAMEQVRWSPCSRVGQTVFPVLGRGPAFGSSGHGIDESPCSQYSLLSTMKVLRFVLDAMGELPGRKSMVVFSDSMPLENQEVTLDLDAPPAGVDTDQLNYRFALRKVAEKAIRSSVVIYSVDTQGLQYTGMTAADSPNGTFRDITNQINSTMASRSRLLITRREGGEMISRQTGGFQIRNSNSFELDRILEDQSGYYLIGYRPTDETFNRQFHHIKAKVKRSGMTLRTRFGFFGVSEEEAKKNQRSVRDLTNLALMSPFGKQDINLDITSFFANDKTAGSVIRSFVYLDADDMTFNSVNGKREGSLDLHGVIFGDNGVVVEQLKRGASLSLTEEDYEQAKRHGLNITFDIPVRKLGAYQVRIAARDRNSSHIGSAGQFVAVPSLNNNRLAVSGIVLGTDSKGFALADPGARRFTPNSDVHFGYIVYNAANEAGGLRNLVMQTKLFRDGKVVSSGPETPISAANQTDLASVYSGGVVHLPAELEPGNYYLQVLLVETAAKDKKTALVQWANFDIVK